MVAGVGASSASAIDYDTDMWFGTIRPPLAPPTGEVVDRIFVGDNFKGLTYADQDLFGFGTTPTLFYSIRQDTRSGTTYLDTIATPVAPHTAPPPVVDRYALVSQSQNALTFAAPDLSFGPTILYYLREDGTSSQMGTATPPALSSQDRFPTANKLDSLTFTATDVGFGANLLYYLRTDTGITHFGTLDPHLPGTATDRWILGLENYDAFVFTDTDVGYGANLFYYIRHDGTTGQHLFGTINPLNGTSVDRFLIGGVTDEFSELTFTTTDVGYGPNLFYYLRSEADAQGGGGGGGGGEVPEGDAFGAVGLGGLLLGMGRAWGAWRRRVAAGS